MTVEEYIKVNKGRSSDLPSFFPAKRIKYTRILYNSIDKYRFNIGKGMDTVTKLILP